MSSTIQRRPLKRRDDRFAVCSCQDSKGFVAMLEPTVINSIAWGPQHRNPMMCGRRCLGMKSETACGMLPWSAMPSQGEPPPLTAILSPDQKCLPQRWALRASHPPRGRYASFRSGGAGKGSRHQVAKDGGFFKLGLSCRLRS